MPAYALISVSCPHCQAQFLGNAKLLRPGGESWCPECEQLFVLDGASEGTRKTLQQARRARRRRRERLAELRAHWAEPAPTEKPLLMGDVLRELDHLLERMNDLAQRPKA